MPQELKIMPVLNGFIVHAGCQVLVFNDPDKLAGEFAEWLKQPEQVEKRYRELMEKKGLCPAPPPQAEPIGLRTAEEACRVSGPANPVGELRRDPRH